MLLTLVRRARRRLFQNELLFQGANSASAALLAFILLMLLGTQILSWQVALLLPLAAAAAGLYVARKRVPSLYGVAQIVDRRLSLSDTLSTAFYYNETNPAAAVSPEIRAFQFEAAQRMAASVDPKRAIPYSMPRSVYAMAVLAVVASSLFALRYGLTHSLDLQPPLARILQQTFGTPERTEQARNVRRQPRTDPSSPDENQSVMQDDSKDETTEQQTQPENGSDPGSEADAAQSDQMPLDDGKKGDEEGDVAEGDDTNGGEEQAGNTDDSKSGQSGDPKGQPDKESGKPDANSSASENSSLLNKMKDFAQNLLSKMKSPNQSGNQQQSGEKNSQQGKGQQSGKQQESAKNGQKQDGQKGDSQEGQGDQGETSQDQEGEGTGKNDAKQSSKQPGSGVGSQDGDKRIKQAEQLAAMGKISEIIGKRSANVTGEATVEVKSTSQQIRTPYAQRGVQHSQGGAEINRDEVPVALQSYVEHYFEQVRKQAPAKK